WMEEEKSVSKLPEPETTPPEFKKPENPEEKISALEQSYSGRIVDEIHQFGYDMFGVPKIETQEKLDHIAAMPMGAVQDDFILNSGDELEIVFSGQRTDRDIYKVNSEGLLLIPDFPPIPAAGRSIGQV